MCAESLRSVPPAVQASGLSLLTEGIPFLRRNGVKPDVAWDAEPSGS